MYFKDIEQKKNTKKGMEMRKNTTKKFLMREDRFEQRMISQVINEFILKKSNKLKTRKNDTQYGCDSIGFSNIFSLNTKTSLNTSNKIVDFKMVLCLGTNKLHNFLIGETEVTQELYEKIMGNNPSYFNDKNSYDPKGQYNKKLGDTSKHPVEQVSWLDAITFCNKLSELQGLNPCYKIVSTSNLSITGVMTKHICSAKVDCDTQKNGYRLPTNEEWQYAALAGTNNSWAGTNVRYKVDEYAWFGANSNDHTHPVATKKPNEWGLYDMNGNVSEWNNDGTETHKVTSMSSWNSHIAELKITSEFNGNRSIAYKNWSVGFRLAKKFEG